MKCFYKMFCRYFLRNKLFSKLSANLCNRCLSRLISTEIDHKSDLIPITKRSKEPKEYYLCIKDESIAETVAKYVTTDIPDNSVIFESCPGPGVLTKRLLNTTQVQSVRVFEDNPFYLNSLKIIGTQFPERLHIIDKQILNFRSFLLKHLNEYEFEVQFWTKDIVAREWGSVPAIRFVAVLSPKGCLFLRFIMKILLRKELFFSLGRTEFFVFVSETEYRYITAKPQSNYNFYRSTTVLYNTLFDIETLETIPYNKFEIYTKFEIKANLPKKALKEFKGNAKLIRLTPKLYLDEFNEQTLQDYSFFVRQTFMKRKNYIIPFLENWFPNCGPDLIMKGIPVFKYFGDLRPEEVFEIFKYFYERNDYQNSLYKMLAMREDFETVDDIKDDAEDIEEDHDF